MCPHTSVFRERGYAATSSRAIDVAGWFSAPQSRVAPATPEISLLLYRSLIVDCIIVRVQIKGSHLAHPSVPRWMRYPESLWGVIQQGGPVTWE